jgi:hypothetical protein
VGKALAHRQVTAADTDGLWTLQTTIFPENRASIALHRSAGFRTIGLRERIGRHHGVWRDTGPAGAPPDADHVAGSSSASRSRTRASMSSRIGRTASTPCPAGSSSAQSR